MRARPPRRPPPASSPRRRRTSRTLVGRELPEPSSAACSGSAGPRRPRASIRALRALAAWRRDGLARPRTHARLRSAVEPGRDAARPRTPPQGDARGVRGTPPSCTRRRRSRALGRRRRPAWPPAAAHRPPSDARGAEWPARGTRRRPSSARARAATTCCVARGEDEEEHEPKTRGRRPEPRAPCASASASGLDENHRAPGGLLDLRGDIGAEPAPEAAVVGLAHHDEPALRSRASRRIAPAGSPASET